MPTQSKCSHCDPPGSGHCKDSQTTAKSGNGKCQTCYGTGKCRYCNGMGLEMSALEKAKETLLSLWWISWFGIIGGFLWVGVWEYRIISPQRGVSPRFSLTLLIVTSLLWVVFYAVEAKARARVDGAKNKRVVVDLLTLAGTFLATSPSWESYSLFISHHGSSDTQFKYLF
jgi:CDP-diglyceride synthetase